MRVDVVSVQDGDSLVVRPRRSFWRPRRSRRPITVRLYAIDAPETDQQRGAEAREYLRRLVTGRTDLDLQPVHTDRYGRQVAILYYRRRGRKQSVNRTMVEQGLARWYQTYGGQELGLDHAERQARRRKRGVWSSRRSVAPWDHRRKQRQAAARRRQRPGRLRWALLAAAIAAAIAAAVALGLLPP